METVPPRKRAKLRSPSGAAAAKAPSGASVAPAALKQQVAAKLAKTAAQRRDPSLIKWSPEAWASWKACPAMAQVERTPLWVLKTPLASVYESEAGAPAEGGEPFFTLDEACERLTKEQQLCTLFVEATPDGDSVLYNRAEMYEEWDLDRKLLAIEATQAKDLEPRVLRFVPPSRAQVADFISCVKGAVRDDPGASVGVVSTHGMNRAGVLVCSYLVEVGKMPLRDAVARFAKARPPGIYSKSCMLALQRRYAPTVPLAVPAAPEWDKEAVTVQAAKPVPSTLPPLGAPAGPKPAGNTPTSSSSSSSSRKVAAAGAAAGAAAAAPQTQAEKAEPPPPKPWQRGWSKRENRAFFFNPDTKKSVWKLEDCK